jgi:hypothetical protein
LNAPAAEGGVRDLDQVRWDSTTVIVPKFFSHVSRRALNPAFENLGGAWENDTRGAQLPVAIHPTYVHPRLRSQRSCFTIHGKRKDGLDKLVPQSILRCCIVDAASRQSMIDDLALLGITESVVFPDLDGLAAELKERFGF